jgi:hypothetical protein
MTARPISSGTARTFVARHGGNVRVRYPEEIRFAPDSPLEGDGFELSVPRVMAGDSGRRVPAAIAVFEVAGTAVALQRGTKVVGPGCHPEFR